MLSPWFRSGTAASALVRSFLSQSWPSAPSFALQDLVTKGSEAGRVFIVTGANTGIGLEVAKALYISGATIYLACRSPERAAKAIDEIRSTSKDTAPGHYADGGAPEGDLHFLHLDLADMASVHAFAAAFAARESRLDLLFHIAGVGNVPRGTKTAQGLEAHLGINCVAPLALTQALHPLLRSTASAPGVAAGSVRVVWTASLSMETFTPRGGVDLAVLDDDDALSRVHPWRAYGVSKCGNWFLARECARRFRDDGIVSAAVNPGQLRTDAWRHVSGIIMSLLRPTMYDARMGVLPMLYAAFAPEVATEGCGCYVVPWGRIAARSAREDIEDALRGGVAERFWEWCDAKARGAAKKGASASFTAQER
ncbi:NAD(P)-binding protein [Colletotrichum eremochloae]|nr:NAD(P)-binding protein [Colletotrichum eremochloae]